MAQAIVFRRERVIRFSDCDPAGIVFYPQYFVMFNGLLEDWFSDDLGVGFDALVLERRIGVPTSAPLAAWAIRSFCRSPSSVSAGNRSRWGFAARAGKDNSE
jgi:hypothetical protein